MKQPYRYKNPWHTRHQPRHGPEFIETSTEPVFYRGAMLFFHPHKGWDIVINGTRLSNRASKAAAKEAVDRHVNALLDQRCGEGGGL